MKQRAWVIAVAAAAVLLLGFACLFYVPGSSRGVLEKGDSSLRVELSPGLHFRWPPFAPVSLYPTVALRLEGELDAASREGAVIEMRYSLNVRLLDGGLEAVHRARSGRPLVVFLKERAESAARATALSRPLPELLTPGAIQALREALQETFDPLGVWIDPEARLTWAVPLSPERRAQLASLREQMQDTGLKILLVGLDGADWDLIDQLDERGEVPNLSRLKREGAWGSLVSDGPLLSPLLWTTIATGRSPDVHGVMDFLMKDPASGRMVPISASFRRVKALWNILTDFGLESDFVAWWATWPAEPIAGTMVSDRLSYSLFPFVEQEAPSYGTTYPEEYLDEIRSRLVGDDDIAYDEVKRFVEVTREEFRKLRSWVAERPRAAYRHPVNHLTRILAATRNYHTIALDLLAKGQRRLTAVYYQGIDEINHRFAHFAPPRMDRISEEEFRQYSLTLERFYRYQDELLGELLERVDENTVVIVLSDHGFANGIERPRDATPSIEGRPAKWHIREGIRILSGPVIQAGALGEGHQMDVAPTVLRLLGVPGAEDLQGQVWENAIDPGWLERFEPRTIASYDDLGSILAVSSTGGGVGAQEMIENLRRLGYIGGGDSPDDSGEGAETLSPPSADGSPLGGSETLAGNETVPSPPAGTTASYHGNLAGILLRKGDLDGAEREYRVALAKMPHFGPALGGLAAIEHRRDRPEEALRLALEGLQHSPDPDETLILAVTRLFLQLDRAEEGAQRLGDLVRRVPRRVAPRVCQGILLLKAGKGSEAEQVLKRALKVDPG
ncbi:MAG: alkaline phosphatase family protein, partial [Acidobacteriota bacterium]